MTEIKPCPLMELKQETIKNMGDTNEPFFREENGVIHLAPEQLVFKTIDYLHGKGYIRTPASPDAVREYEQFVMSFWKGKETSWLDLAVMGLGLCGEAGESTDHIKKHIRDGKIDMEKFKLELGDTLYYLVRICLEYGFNLEELMRSNTEKLVAKEAALKAQLGE